jgi:hypothetical protein
LIGATEPAETKLPPATRNRPEIIQRMVTPPVVFTGGTIKQAARTSSHEVLRR